MGASSALINRASTITVGPVQIVNIGQSVGLSCWFKVRRSLKAKEPNTCDLRIWNLSPETLQALAQAAQPLPGAATAPNTISTVLPVSIVAGYKDAGTSQIFLGEMRSAQTVIDGPDRVTELTTGDGDEAMILARSTQAFGPGQNAFVVASKLLVDAKLAPGNIGTVQPILAATPMYTRGVCKKGATWDLLQDLARSCGLEVTVQGGTTQWTVLGQPLPGDAYVLSADTGLIGSPTVDSKGVLTCQTLLLPGIKPGSVVVLASEYVKGAYRVTSVEYTGSTFGQEWYCAIEAKKPGLAP